MRRGWVRALHSEPLGRKAREHEPRDQLTVRDAARILDAVYRFAARWRRWRRCHIGPVKATSSDRLYGIARCGSPPEGFPESVELARQLVTAVLKGETVRRATELDELLREQSPLALVRAVTLAESVLQVRELATTPAMHRG